MSERPEDAPSRRTPVPGEGPGSQGESEVWSLISTLVAGPALWGGIGFGGDALLGTSGRPLTAAGIVLGFVLSFYIVYVRSFRPDAPASAGANGRAAPPTSGDVR